MLNITKIHDQTVNKIPLWWRLELILHAMGKERILHAICDRILNCWFLLLLKSILLHIIFKSSTVFVPSDSSKEIFIVLLYNEIYPQQLQRDLDRHNHTAKIMLKELRIFNLFILQIQWYTVEVSWKWRIELVACVEIGITKCGWMVAKTPQPP